MKLRPRLAVPVAAALALGAAACTPSAEAQGVAVVAEIYPLAWIAEEVGGDLVTVTTLVPAGADVHTYELSPRQATALSRAALAVVTSGAAPAVDAAVTTNPPERVVDAIDHITLRPAVPHDHDHDDHAEHDDHADPDHGPFDAHTWLDLPGLPAVADAVADALSGVDPDNAATFAANAADLTERLADLDEDYRTGLAACEHTTFLVTHPAFGYLTDAYGLTQVGISGIDEDTEPSPARLAQIADVVARTGTTTVFLADTSSPKVAEVLADELGLTVATLSGLTGAAEGEDYVSLAEANLAALRTGLGCP